MILFDDYGHSSFSETRLEVEKFFEDKDCDFLQFMTGQAMIVKKASKYGLFLEFNSTYRIKNVLLYCSIIERYKRSIIELMKQIKVK